VQHVSPKDQTYSGTVFSKCNEFNGTKSPAPLVRRKQVNNFIGDLTLLRNASGGQSKPSQRTQSVSVSMQKATPINPHGRHSASPITLISSLWRNRTLALQLTRREVVGRYRGSVLGLAWSFFNPVLMLLVYTFFFAVIFKSRWGTGGTDSKTDFAVILFVGMIVHGLFAEILNRSPRLILDNANYVKKVVFPIEILPAVSIGVALFHAIVSLGVLLIAFFIFNGFIHWTAVFIPLVLMPLIILSLGAAWFLASLGVYLRDVAQTIGLFTTVLMFLSPVFYPATSLPEAIRPWLMLNPLTFIIEQAREVMIWGRLPDLQGLSIYTLCAVIIAWLGFIWFQKTKKGFADVL